MRILLTTPPMQHYNVSGVVFSNFGAYNLACLAGAMGAGHVVRISDYLQNRWHPHSLEEDIRSFEPDIVAVANPFSGYTDVVCKMARLAKSLAPKTITVTGGQASTALWEKHLENGFDYVVRYEGEETFRDLIQALATDPEAAQSVPGVAWCDRDGQKRLNPYRSPIDDLDRLPMAARELAPIRRGILTPGKAGLMEISRGCPYHCSFCSQPSFWGRVRRRSNDAILDELQHLVRTGYTEICFTDDTVGVDFGRPDQFPDQTAGLLEGILSRGLKVGLGFCMRADTAARYPEFVALAAKAGLVLVNMGFESYTKGGLAAVGKGDSSLEINQKAAETLRANKVLIWGSHIYGAPSQTDEDMHATLKWGPQYSDFFRMTMASPLPGSAAFIRMRRDGVIDDDASTRVTYYHYTYKDSRDPHQVQRAYLKALAGYYLAPENLLKMLDADPFMKSMARQSYKGAAFFGLHRTLGLAGISRL